MDQETVIRQIEGLLASASAPWCVSCREKMCPNGHDRYCNQRWFCEKCGATCGKLRAYGSRTRVVKQLRSVMLFEQGYSLRQVIRIVGITNATASKYRKLAHLPQCKCGQNIKHQGWCWWRYQQSPKRQEFMKRWHSKAA